MTYHVGPGPAQVHVKLAFDWQTRPLYNVIVRIEGSTFPDEWIIFGNHHDAWVNGADDPTSGAVALMETGARAGRAAEDRLAAEAHDHPRAVGRRGVGAARLDRMGREARRRAEARRPRSTSTPTAPAKGWLNVGGSHGLQQLVNEVARDVMDPRDGQAGGRGIAAAAGDGHAGSRARGAREGRRRSGSQPLGSGSDYTPFLQHLTLSSLNVGFGGESNGGIYHSMYDTVNWYTKFSDGDFAYGRTLAQLTGTLLLRPVRRARAAVSVHRHGRHAAALRRELESSRPRSKDAKLDLAPVRTAVEALAQERRRATSRPTTGVDERDVAGARRPHGTARRSTRCCFSPSGSSAQRDGLPRRDWFKHQIYAPGFYTGYGVKTMPQIREGLEENRPRRGARGVRKVAAAVNALAAQVEEAAEMLKKSLK